MLSAGFQAGRAGPKRRLIFGKDNKQPKSRSTPEKWQKATSVAGGFDMSYIAMGFGGISTAVMTGVLALWGQSNSLIGAVD